MMSGKTVPRGSQGPPDITQVRGQRKSLLRAMRAQGGHLGAIEGKGCRQPLGFIEPGGEEGLPDRRNSECPRRGS